MAHSRAQKGGQLGANGEWYEGGKFIATTDHPKMSGSRKRNPVRKREVDTCTWEVQPHEGAIAIYPQLAGFEIRERRGAGPFRLNPDLRGEWATPAAIERRESLIARFNAGERWV